MAGPGSGKTRTLVERVRYLLSQPEANPARLLVLTFSNKAAQELRERLAGLGDMMAEMPIGTLHSYGLDFLRRYAEYISLERDFRLLDQARAYLLMEDLLVKFPAGYYIQEDQPFQYLYSLLEDFSRAKDFLRTPQNYLAAVEAMQQAAENGEQSVFKSEDVAKAFERAEIYRIYETEKKARGQVDFSDLIMLTVQLLSTKPEVLAEERQRYDEILVDEYQDINYASGELLRWLTSPSRGGKANLWTVGDVNQSIYRFRGAYPHQASVTAFQQEYGGPKPVTGLELSNNYRSVSSIVDLANHLRGLMPEGPTRPLQSFNQEELDQINLYYNEYTDTDEEIATISASLKTHREAGHSYSDMAILCQRHEQADEITRNLTAAGVPVTRLGQFFNRPEIQQGLAALAAPSNNTGIALIRLASSKFSVLKIP
jgi:superfamily I DNA/RNA helicase